MKLYPRFTSKVRRRLLPTYHTLILCLMHLFIYQTKIFYDIFISLLEKSMFSHIFVCVFVLFMCKNRP